MAASSRLGVLMKLDKNQRKPRVFKASDLCPYYNRRVNTSDNTRRFHRLASLSQVIYVPVIASIYPTGSIYSFFTSVRQKSSPERRLVDYLK
jgi:hypothetical protein